MYTHRREFLVASTGLALAAAAPTIALLAAEPAAKPSPDKPAGEEGVTATEDLMREHGALGAAGAGQG